MSALTGSNVLEGGFVKVGETDRRSHAYEAHEHVKAQLAARTDPSRALFSFSTSGDALIFAYVAAHSHTIDVWETTVNAKAFYIMPKRAPGAVTFSVVIPYVGPEHRTEWHPTESTGPFSRLVRGRFNTEGEAIAWARAHLNGTPYEIQAIAGEV